MTHRQTTARSPGSAAVIDPRLTPRRGVDSFWELATDLFAISGADGMLYALNPAWERLLGWSREELTAQPLTAFIHPDDFEATVDVLARTHISGARIDELVNRWRRRDGSYCTLAWSGASDGDIWCVVGRDVTGHAQERTLLREAQRIVELTNWEWHLDSDVVTTNLVARVLTGDQPVAPFGLDGILSRVAPEDREAVLTGLDALRAGTTTSARLEHRVLTPSGELRWLDTRCRLLRDPDGRPCVVRGTSQDITERVVAREQLESASDFWQGTMDSLDAHVAVLDPDGEIVAVNQAWRRFEEENGACNGTIGENYLALGSTDGPHASGVRARAGVQALLAGEGERFSMEYAARGTEGERWFALTATRFSGTGPVSVVVAHHDITERRMMEEEARKQAALLDVIDVAVVATDDAGLVTHWNRGADVLYGWTRDEATGRRASELIIADDGPSGIAIVDDLRSHGRWEGRVCMRRKDGTIFPAHVRDALVVDVGGEPSGMIGVSIDITTTIAAEDSLRDARNHLAAVTNSMGEGLLVLDSAGRVTLMNQAAEEMLGWTLAGLRGRVLHDLVHYRRPDGSPQPAAASTILQTLELRTTIRAEDEIFMRRDGTELPTSYTAAPLVTTEGLEGCVIVFTDATVRQAEQRELRRKLEALSWAGRVQDALREERFVLYAQPILDLATDEIVQHELLLRMREPNGEIVGPASYLQIAEEHNLIGDIDRWVIRRASRLAARGLPVELNVSGGSISDPELITHIERCLQETGADPGLMVFEITETALVSDEQAGRNFVQRVHELGCKLALDDFGTGYGGFTYLKQLPVDYLKIDIEFVRDLRTSEASLHVVEAVVNLARGFGLQTVAEGVEDVETLTLLKRLGVDYAQGYYIARPGPLEDAFTDDNLRSSISS
jgi:PAS domain S-box-containing protein